MSPSSRYQVDAAQSRIDPSVTTVLTQTVARLLLVPIFMVALAILVKGYADVGDGFSAGVVAALGVLLQDVAFGYRAIGRLTIVRLAPYGALAGALIALGVTFVPVLTGEPLLRHRPGAGEPVAHLGALELITPVLFDIGVFLVVFGFAVGVIGMIARMHPRPIGPSRGTGATGGDEG
ncbi:MAG: MnhB domain-containing protein [Chloroflexia bacterium]|nr:MnhB domain-containing protein [Chloroflexia bacterium]MDQ3513753.1 MnhB domain-containing protein [Chloroflexota bacterium]